MQVQYIYHSGFLLETAQSYYLFDYYQGALPALNADKPLVAFFSHSHRDHYQPSVFATLRRMGMRDVLAVLADDIPKRNYPPDTDVMRVCAEETYALPRGETLKTLRSTDSGVAFLLITDEGTIYHAGDLNDWTWSEEDEAANRQMRERYRRQIDTLIGRPIDVAFVPLDPRQEEHYAGGMLYFLDKTDAKQVYPMHYWKKPGIIRRFLTAYPQYAGVIQYTENDSEGD